MPSTDHQTARASLIDRLIDGNPRSNREAKPLRSQSRRALKASVRRDLQWLFNTRSPLPPARFEVGKLTVLEYGIPDFGTSYPANPQDQDRLARRITQALTAFEPRLENPRVTVHPVKADEKRLQVTIEAVLAVEQVREPVSFLTILHTPAGSWKVHETK